MPEISPLQSPYRHWRGGLLLELAVMTVFTALLVIAAALLAAAI